MAKTQHSRGREIPLRNYCPSVQKKFCELLLHPSLIPFTPCSIPQGAYSCTPFIQTAMSQPAFKNTVGDDVKTLGTS